MSGFEPTPYTPLCVDIRHKTLVLILIKCLYEQKKKSIYSFIVNTNIYFIYCEIVDMKKKTSRGKDKNFLQVFY